MLCDIMALIAHIRALSPPKTARAFTPAERFGEAWSTEQAFGSVLGLCPGNWGLQLSVPIPGATAGLSLALPGSGSRGTQEVRSPLQSGTAAAASERSPRPSPPDHPSPPQHVTNMVSASEDRCPICLNTLSNAACTMTCLHRFCFNCLWQWAEIKLECPVCRRTVTCSRHSLRGDQFEEQPSLALLGSAQNEAPFRLPDPRASRLNQRLHLEPWFIGGLYPYTGQSIFREHPDVLRLLWSWLHQELGCTFELERRQVLTLAQRILHTLPILGLREERLLEIVQRHLGSRTTAFTQGLIRVIMQWCGRASHQLLLSEESRAVRMLEESPGGISNSTVPRRSQEQSPMVTSTSWGVSRQGREQSPVVSTTWGASRGGHDHSPMASSSWVVSRQGREQSPVVSTTWGASRGGRVWSPMASSSWGSSRGGRERSHMASISSFASRGGQELSPIVSSRPAASQGGGQLSPVASTSAVPSRGGTPEPGPDRSATAATADGDELLGTSTAALQGGPGCPPAPIPGEQEELQREPGEAAARVTAPRWARDSSRWGPWRAQKRKASPRSSNSASHAKKKPPRR
ncbi:unnamed protein product [Bubo scandiacus]